MKHIKLLGIITLFAAALLFASPAFAAAPSATNLSAVETYTEDTTLNLIDIVASDADGGTLLVTLTLSNSTAGSLSTATAGSTTSTFSGGVWTANGPIADVNTLLAGVSFVPALNFNSSFFINTRVDDGSASANGSKDFTGIAVNDAPSATNLSSAETYTEDTPLNLTDIVVSDVDSSSVTATLTLSSPSAGALSTGTSGSVTSTYNAGAGVWTATGVIADVNTLLASVTFTPAANFSSSFTIATSISDGVAAALTGSKAITGTAVNDAPVLDASRTPVLGTIAENASVPTGAVGMQIVSLVDFAIPAGGLDNVTDIDSSPSTGIAITATNSNLTCYYSINSGATWTLLGSVSNASARLLSAGVTNRVYCRAGVGTFGAFSNAITFRAWDQTSGTNGSVADTSTNGGTSAFSLATDTAGLTITSAGNHAPVAGDDEYTVDQNSPGVALAVRGNDTDPDNDAFTITNVGTPDQGGSAQNMLSGTEIGYAPAIGFCGDEEFTYEINDGNGGTDVATVTIHVVNCDTVTEVPTLVSPATGITYYNNVLLPITFTLPETLLHNSLRLIFTSSLETSFVLNLRDAAPGTNTFNVDPRGNIDQLTEVLSTTSTSIPVGIYTVTLTYQDQYGNLAASAISTNVVIANPPSASDSQTTSTTGGSSVANQIQNLIAMGNVQKAEELKKQFPNAPSISALKLSSDNSCSLGSITRTLRSGSTGEDVRTLQKFLNCKGFVVATTGSGSVGNETNKFGPATVKAVKALQKSYNLKSDGIFGSKTRETVNK